MKATRAVGRKGQSVWFSSFVLFLLPPLKYSFFCISFVFIFSVREVSGNESFAIEAEWNEYGLVKSMNVGER